MRTGVKILQGFENMITLDLCRRYKCENIILYSKNVIGIFRFNNFNILHFKYEKYV